MGWRDRDYAKFNENERRALLGSGRGPGRALPPSDEGLTHRGHAISVPSRRRSSARRSKGRTNPAVLLAAAVSLAAATFLGYVKNVPVIHDLLTSPVQSHVSAPHVTAPLATNIVAPPASTTVFIHWSAQDIAPAANAGRVCVTPAGHGRICASYVVGERPADNLTRELERRGLSVQSSG
jgi:hypothetical protein